MSVVSKVQPWALVRALRKRVEGAWHAARGDAPPRPGVGGALDQLDDEFHATYERSRADLADDQPVFVVLANDLVLFHHGRRQAWSFSPRAYHVLKEVAHVPLALFASLGANGKEPPEHTLGRARALRAWIERAEREAGADPDLRRVLARSAEVLRAPLTTDALEALARDTGPILRRMIDRATELQLDALHERVEAALAELSPEQRERLEVVVTGNHQARTRSLPMQYFRKRLREPPDRERRVTYAEAVGSEQEALALLGTRAMDRELARAFFGDPTRMQRDLLGDAAHALLKKRDLGAIE